MGAETNFKCVIIGEILNKVIWSTNPTKEKIEFFSSLETMISISRFRQLKH